jgi:hypothetical protein
MEKCKCGHSLDGHKYDFFDLVAEYCLISGCECVIYEPVEASQNRKGEPQVEKLTKQQKREVARDVLEIMGTISFYHNTPRSIALREALRIRDRAARKAVREWVNSD